MYGIIVAMISAFSFGIAVPLASITYSGGANPITLAIIRTMVMSVIAVLLVLLLKRDWRVPQEAVFSTSLVAIGMACLSIGILNAVNYIPVSLAILIMYIYPALVVVLETILLGQRLSILRLITCLLAFTGLALVLGPSFSDLDWRGIAFAVLACISSTTVMLATRTARRHINEVALMLWGIIGGIPILLFFWPLLGGIAIPDTQLAWTSLAAVCFFFVVAFSCYIISMRYISAGRASMIYNIEPLVAIVGATVLLGESLLLVQLFGAAFVITAVLLAARE